MRQVGYLQELLLFPLLLGLSNGPVPSAIPSTAFCTFYLSNTPFGPSKPYLVLSPLHDSVKVQVIKLSLCNFLQSIYIPVGRGSVVSIETR